MKATLKTTAIATVLAVLTINGIAWAKTADRTNYDCRVVVGYNTITTGTKPPTLRVPILACPHKDLMAAGKCQTSWLFGMRCKE